MNNMSEASVNTKQEEHLNQLDTNRVFKGKSDTVKALAKQGKKKQAANSRTNTSSRFQGTGPKSHR